MREEFFFPKNFYTYTWEMFDRIVKAVGITSCADEYPFINRALLTLNHEVNGDIVD
jgi:hypothetical protein